MTTRFDTLPYGTPEGTISRLLAENGQSVFPVVDPAMRVLGLASRADLLAAMGPGGPGAWSVVRGVPLLPTNLPAANALQTMRACGEPILPVVNASGQIVGIFTASNAS
jgi:CBS domain-containing protein